VWNHHLLLQAKLKIKIAATKENMVIDGDKIVNILEKRK